MTLVSVYNVAQDTTNYPCHTCSPAVGGGYDCLVNTAGFFAFGQQATVNNGLIGKVITQVTVANVKTQISSTGHVGIIIVNASPSLQYTFSSTFSYGSTSPSGSFTLTDNNNTYALQNGDAILVKWDQGSSNGLAISCNSQQTFGAGNGASIQWNGSAFGAVCTSNDLAAQMFINQNVTAIDLTPELEFELPGAVGHV